MTGIISESVDGQAPPPLTIAGAPITNGTVGAPFPGFTVTAAGGKPPYAYSVPGPALPPGLALNASTGVVSGTPTTAGTTVNIMIRVTDASENSANLTPFTMNIAAVPTLTIAGTPVTSATQGVAYGGFTVSASGGVPPYNYSVNAGTLPSGLTLSSTTGAVSGTPTTVQTQTGVVIRVTDNNGATANLPGFSIAVAAPPVTISGSPVTSAQVAVAYPGFSAVAGGGVSPYTYSLPATALPAGLSLNTSTGAVSGTPTGSGTTSGIVIRATDSASNHADLPAFAIAVAPAPNPLAIAGTPVTTATQGAAYPGFTVSASGGTGPYSYAIHAGALPAGLSLNASTGAVTGTPTTVQTQSGIVIRATDAVAATADLASFSIAVAAPPLTISGSPVTSGTQGAPYAGFTVTAGGGVPPYAFSLPATQLPPGISLDPVAGTVSGAPTSGGTTSGIVIRVTDSAAATANLPAFSIAVTAKPPLTIGGTPVTTAIQGQPYAGFTVSGAGGTPPYAYAVTAGVLPAGISLNSVTGVVSGTPTTVQNQTNIIISVTDAASGNVPLAPFAINVAAPSGAIISSVTYPIGALTQAGFGQVRLSSAPGPYSGNGGLGLLQNGIVASLWKISQIGGTPGHWKIGTTTLGSTPLSFAESAAALTPAPTAAGVTANLNGGPYTFSVTCTSSLGVVATAQIKITITPNAASFADNDALSLAMVGGSGVTFVGEGGSTLLYSVGANRTAKRNILSMIMPSAVTVSHADPTRPGLIGALEMTASTANLIFSAITMSDANANVTAGLSAAWWISSATNCTWNNCGASYSAAQAEPAGLSAIRFDGATNLTFNAFSAVGCDSGFTTSGESGGVSNVVFNGLLVDQFFNNATFLGSPCSGITINDLIVMRPVRSSLVPGDHIDAFQCSNPPNNDIVQPTINRAFVFGNGDGLMQGLPFTGGGSGWQVDGLIQIIKAGNGSTWTSMDTTPRTTFFKNFTSLFALAGGASGANFTGGIASGILTVTSVPAASGPNAVASILAGYNVAFAANGLLNGGQAIAAYGAAGTTGTGGKGTYSIPGAPNIAAGSNLVATEDGSFGAGPSIYFRPSDVSADWVGSAGSFVLSSGFSYGPVEGITQAGAVGPVPALVSVASSVVKGNGSTTVGGLDCFTVHNPRGVLEAFTPAQWLAMTPKQIIGIVVANLLPKSGGPLDAGGGNAYGGLTFAGLANDGSGLAYGHWLP